MVAFIQSYGLWIALAFVFAAMHWFGRGCCGGGHHRDESERQAARGDPGKSVPTAKALTRPPRPGGSCH